jgi:hypothetical protein
MAKRGRKAAGEGPEHPGGRKIEGFAEDLGRLLGTARAKAEGWLGQRQTIVKNLTQLRDTANKLLSDLGHEAQAMVRRRGRPAGGGSMGTAMPGPGRPAGTRKRRKMSAAARKKISDAQKARWAKQKAGEKKK